MVTCCCFLACVWRWMLMDVDSWGFCLDILKWVSLNLNQGTMGLLRVTRPDFYMLISHRANDKWGKKQQMIRIKTKQMINLENQMTNTEHIWTSIISKILNKRKKLHEHQRNSRRQGTKTKRGFDLCGLILRWCLLSWWRACRLNQSSKKDLNRFWTGSTGFLLSSWSADHSNVCFFLGL